MDSGYQMLDEYFESRIANYFSAFICTFICEYLCEIFKLNLAEKQILYSQILFLEFA